MLWEILTEAAGYRNVVWMEQVSLPWSRCPHELRGILWWMLLWSSEHLQTLRSRLGRSGERVVQHLYMQCASMLFFPTNCFEWYLVLPTRNWFVRQLKRRGMEKGVVTSEMWCWLLVALGVKWFNPKFEGNFDSSFVMQKWSTCWKFNTCRMTQRKLPKPCLLLERLDPWVGNALQLRIFLKPSTTKMPRNCLSMWGVNSKLVHFIILNRRYMRLIT